MKYFKVKIALFLAMIIFSLRVFSDNQDATANQFYDFCRNPYEQVQCNSYIQGFFNGFTLGSSFNYKWSALANEGFSIETVRNIFLKFMKNNPSMGDQAANSALFISMAKAGLITKK